MSQISDSYGSKHGPIIEQSTLGRFMARIYLWMFLGLGISALTALMMAANPVVYAVIFRSRFIMLALILAQFAAVFALSGFIKRINAVATALIFILYSILSGVTFSVILLVYAKSNVIDAFLITSAAFFGLSLVGYSTKRDLKPLSTFCIMGIFGMIALSLLYLFIPAMHNNLGNLIIAGIGVVVFSGLTAYDTQRIRLNFVTYGNQLGVKYVIREALSLYLNFINLFLSILRLMGGRR